MKLVYEEHFKTKLNIGEWRNTDHPYKKVWGGVETKTSARNPRSTVDCYLTTDNIKVGSEGLVLCATQRENAFCGVEIRTNEYYSYGYFEIEAKVNTSKGICPAFWLTGSRDSKSKIEYEIDVFECFGSTPDIIKFSNFAHLYPNGSKMPKLATIHKFDCFERLDESLTPVEPHDSFFRGNWGDGFHKFALDWREDSITWLVDGKPMYRLDTARSQGGKYPFDEPLKVILTVYSGVDVCSPRTGLPDDTTDWEKGCSMTVKSVHFYQY